MGELYFNTWVMGFALAAVVSVIIRSESLRVVRAGRLAFGLALTADLIFSETYFVAAHGAGAITPTAKDSGAWWALAIGCGIPVAVASGIVVRRAFAGQPVTLLLAVLATVALYLAFPLGFVPPHRPLTGLGRFEHTHHLVDGLALFVPVIIVLAGEVLRGRIPHDELSPSLLRSLRHASGRVVLGSVIAVVFTLGLLTGNGPEAFYFMAAGTGLLILGAVVQTQLAARRMRRDFKT